MSDDSAHDSETSLIELLNEASRLHTQARALETQVRNRIRAGEVLIYHVGVYLHIETSRLEVRLDRSEVGVDELQSILDQLESEALPASCYLNRTITRYYVNELELRRGADHERFTLLHTVGDMDSGSTKTFKLTSSQLNKLLRETLDYVRAHPYRS